MEKSSSRDDTITDSILKTSDLFSNKDHTYSLILFHLDLVQKKVNISRAGNDLKHLFIKPEFSLSPYGFKNNNPTDIQYTSYFPYFLKNFI